jgi:hypothetical protein
MVGASWKRSERRPDRLVKGIALTLIAAVAVGLLVFATLALVGLDCPNAYRTWLAERSM